MVTASAFDPSAFAELNPDKRNQTQRDFLIPSLAPALEPVLVLVALTLKLQVQLEGLCVVSR